MSQIPQEIVNAFRKVYNDLPRRKGDRLEMSYREPDPNSKTRLLISLVEEETIVNGRPLEFLVSVWFDQSENLEGIASRCINRLISKRDSNDPNLEEIA